MCESQVWRAGEHWRCGLLKGHELTHAWVLVEDGPFMEDEDIEDDDEDPGQDETNT